MNPPKHGCQIKGHGNIPLRPSRDRRPSLGKPPLQQDQGHRLGDFKRAWATARVKAGLASVVKAAGGTIVKRKDGTPRYVFEKTIHDFRRTAARNPSRAAVRRDVAKAITGA